MKSLSKESIRRVREVEAQAADIRAKAEEQAAARVEETERLCAIAAERTIAEVDASLQEELTRVKEKADQLVKESRREVEEDVAAMEADARERMRDAVKLIVWEMYDSCQ